MIDIFQSFATFDVISTTHKVSPRDTWGGFEHQMVMVIKPHNVNLSTPSWQFLCEIRVSSDLKKIPIVHVFAKKNFLHHHFKKRTRQFLNGVNFDVPRLRTFNTYELEKSLKQGMPKLIEKLYIRGVIK
jgi:hypothetical protein